MGTTAGRLEKRERLFEMKNYSHILMEGVLFKQSKYLKEWREYSSPHLDARSSSPPTKLSPFLLLANSTCRAHGLTKFPMSYRRYKSG